MGQPGEVFVCPRLPHILQHVRQDNTRKDGGLWFCKAQIMLYVSPGWGPVFTVGLNVSSGRQQLKFHQYHLSSLGWTNSVVSPLKLILGQLAYVTTVKLGASLVVIPNISSYFCSSFSHVYSSLSGFDFDFFTLFLLGGSAFLFHTFAQREEWPFCPFVLVQYINPTREIPQRSLPNPVWKKSTEWTVGHLHKGAFVLLVDSIKFIVLVLETALWIPASALNVKKIQ